MAVASAPMLELNMIQVLVLMATSAFAACPRTADACGNGVALVRSLEYEPGALSLMGTSVVCGQQLARDACGSGTMAME